MKVLIGSDGLGYHLKEDLKGYLEVKGIATIDIGVESPTATDLYPDIANTLAVRISDGETDRGILICGTGIGMAIVANKVPGVRAGCAHDPYSAERLRKSNNAQIITFGAQIIGSTLAELLLDHWLDSEFSDGRSAPKVDRINQLEIEHMRK